MIDSNGMVSADALKAATKKVIAAIPAKLRTNLDYEIQALEEFADLKTTSTDSEPYTMHEINDAYTDLDYAIPEDDLDEHAEPLRVMSNGVRQEHRKIAYFAFEVIMMLLPSETVKILKPEFDTLTNAYNFMEVYQ